MISYPIVVTTIFPPSKAIKLYVKYKHKLIVIGDSKTPSNWKYKNCDYYPIASQHKMFPTFSKIIPLNHYARKNLGYLIAMKACSSFIETDDDTFPYDHFPKLINGKTITLIKSKELFFNAYKYATFGKTTVWQRGYPLQLILNKSNFLEKSLLSNNYEFPIQQGLINGDTDVDAIYRLVNNEKITFKSNCNFSIDSGVYSPINSQNTFWKRNAFLFMYLPSFVSPRVTDIYRGYIAQRMLKEINEYVSFTAPSTYQIRNPHNYIKDFKDEMDLYLSIEEFVTCLDKMKLNGSIENKYLMLFKQLNKYGFIIQDEIDAVSHWIKEVSKL